MPFVPAHEAHAIDKASATISLGGPSVQSDDWLKILLTTAELGKSRKFTHFTEGVGATFSVVHTDPAGGWPIEARTQMHSVGAGFRRQSADGRSLVEFLVNRNEVRIDLFAYVRWTGFRALILDIAQTILPTFPSQSVVGQIKLEYWDRFVDADEQGKWADVFRSDGRLAPWTTASNQHWHSYMGWFDVTAARKRLVNLHIDTADEPVERGTRRAARVYTSTSTYGDNFGVADRQGLEERLNDLHQLSKAALGDVLSNSMQSAITLFSDTEPL
jgi:uncharacterized protein (TIGR04255 family)